jgi:drug/metabolite transporter (DMT)-like permease
MQQLGATDAATISTLEPVVTLLLAFLVLHEILAPMQVAGAVLVIAAVAVLTRVR